VFSLLNGVTFSRFLSDFGRLSVFVLFDLSTILSTGKLKGKQQQ
jgi:hypothetical protein